MKYKFIDEVRNKIINIDINDIVAMNIYNGDNDDYGNLRIYVPNDKTFFTDKKYKKEIEKLMNKKNLYISKNLTIYVDKIISMNIENYDEQCDYYSYLKINTQYNDFSVDKRYKKQIERFKLRKKIKNF